MDRDASGASATAPHSFRDGRERKQPRPPAMRRATPTPLASRALTSIALIDRRTLQREALEHVLTTSGRVSVWWTARRLSGSLDLLRRRPPDVLVFVPEDDDDYAELPSICAISPSVRTVVVGVADRPEVVARCAQNGVVGYLPSDASTAQLLDTVERVRAGEVVCPQQVLKALFRYLFERAPKEPPAPPAAAAEELTRREREVLRLLAQGLTNKQIAEGLTIEVATVKSHVHRILGKLNLERRSQVVACLRSEPTRAALAHLVG
jgi:two-component system, NarL family, nitrate/nitrite response regulator NarL